MPTYASRADSRHANTFTSGNVRGVSPDAACCQKVRLAPDGQGRMMASARQATLIFFVPLTLHEMMPTQCATRVIHTQPRVLTVVRPFVSG
jgi:hypothetical protein